MCSIVQQMPCQTTSLLQKRKHSDIIEWSARMMPKTYNPPTNAVVKSLHLDDISHIGLVIGKNGAVFNAITHQTPGISYIWFDKDAKRIEVWGETTTSINQAFEKLWKRINYVESLNKYDNVYTNLLFNYEE